MVGNYKVITLCGSTRFKEAFQEVQKRLTLQGNIVISVGLFGHGGDTEVWDGMDEGTVTKTKRMLDDMHKRKIDMADEIFVINVGDYIGDSTRSEIAYAKTHGKRVNYLEPHKVMFEEPTDHQPGAVISWQTTGAAEQHPTTDNAFSEPQQDSTTDSAFSEPRQDSTIDNAFNETQQHSATGNAFSGPQQDSGEDPVSDLEQLEAFMRSASRGAVYSPDDATAAMIAYQNSTDPETDDATEGKTENTIGGETGDTAERKKKNKTDAAQPDEPVGNIGDIQKAYILHMLKNGYDIPNTAYFLDIPEDEVRHIWEEFR